MKRTFRKLLLLLFAAAFLGSSALLLGQYADNRQGTDTYQQALSLASGSGNRNRSTAQASQPPAETLPPRGSWVPAPVEEDDPHLKALADLDLGALRAVNPHVLGWILIPQSNVNYPLLQGEDNDYYLQHTWDHKSNSVGAIFLEHQNSPDLTDYNTIVYGHNMLDGSMFAQLHLYTSEDYRRSHPYIYIASDAGVYRYEVFAAYRADVDSVVYGLSFQQEQTKAAFVMHALEHSAIDTGIIPDSTDRILTLSTCSGAGYSNRWVVHARLRMVEAQ